MKRTRNVIVWLILLILLNAGSSGSIYWLHVQRVEALCANILAERIDKSVLECRRQEKNFFLRASMESIQIYTTNHDSANALILRLMRKRLPHDMEITCSDLSDQMGAYKKAFRASTVYRRDHPVGNDLMSMMHMCTESARKCHSLVAAIISESEQHYSAVNRVAGIIALILLIGTPVLTISIAAMIARQVAGR